MNNIFENQYFLLIKKKKITFSAINETNNLVLTKDFFFENYSTKNLNDLLENFLEKNVIEIEKNLGTFIEKINIIFESDNFFKAESSIRNNLKGTNSKHIQVNDLLIDMKNQFKKYSPGYEIIHMVIQKIFIDGNEFKTLPRLDNIENLVIQLKFIYLNEQIIKDFKKILSRYQISISKITSYEYLKENQEYPGENIFKVAKDNIIGLHTNEVTIFKKSPKIQGFFERFFKFFT
tara:strand:- start:147 stop:848 length:702 start_codon:yes stop_codon:yes gene_type:complete